MDISYAIYFIVPKNGTVANKRTVFYSNRVLSDNELQKCWDHVLFLTPVAIFVQCDYGSSDIPRKVAQWKPR